MCIPTPPVSRGAEAAQSPIKVNPETSRCGKGPSSVKGQAQVVLDLLRSADLESLSRKYPVTRATISASRDTFFAVCGVGLRLRQEDLSGG